MVRAADVLCVRLIIGAIDARQRAADLKLLHVQLDRACMRIPCKINLPSEFFTNLNSESSFVLEPGCGESISGESVVIGAQY